MSTINVIVGKKKNIRVSADSTAGIVSTNRNPVTLKNIPTVSNGVTRLDSLSDVVSNTEIEGAVPVYDAQTDKYVIKKLDMTDVTGDLDGGTF